MYKAELISRYIINWCHKYDVDITNVKLQKLLYFLQGKYYKYVGKRLIRDDFYAWRLGPCVPDIYMDYSVYAGIIPKQRDINTEIDHIELVNVILEQYAYFQTWYLVRRSCEEDPWKYTFQIFGDKSRIPFQTIADYYVEM